MSEHRTKGDPEAFDLNWRNRKEAAYNHYSDGAPKNQIQLAFRSHFEVFSELLESFPTRNKHSLETGCGRGTISNYFAKAGWDVTLLDYNESVIDTAKKIFLKQNLEATFKVGDAMNLPYDDNSFDLVTNIGLLEHFEDIQAVMDEQTRVLAPDGWCFSYVVPERPDNVQRYFNWLNVILKALSLSFLKTDARKKPEVFRSDNFSERYLDCLKDRPVKNITVYGMYPLPMVSHSPEFPFSLLPKPIEVPLTALFRAVLGIRRRLYRRHGWICTESFGQAFLVAYQKDV